MTPEQRAVLQAMTVFEKAEAWCYLNHVHMPPDWQIIDFRAPDESVFSVNAAGEIRRRHESYYMPIIARPVRASMKCVPGWTNEIVFRFDKRARKTANKRGSSIKDRFTNPEPLTRVNIAPEKDLVVVLYTEQVPQDASQGIYRWTKAKYDYMARCVLPSTDTTKMTICEWGLFVQHSINILYVRERAEGQYLYRSALSVDEIIQAGKLPACWKDKLLDKGLGRSYIEQRSLSLDHLYLGDIKGSATELVNTDVYIRVGNEDYEIFVDNKGCRIPVLQWSEDDDK